MKIQNRITFARVDWELIDFKRRFIDKWVETMTDDASIYIVYET